MVFKEKVFNKFMGGCTNRLVQSSCNCGYCAELDTSKNIIQRVHGSFGVASATNKGVSTPHPRTSDPIFKFDQIGEVAPPCLRVNISNATNLPLASSYCTNCDKFNGDYTAYYSDVTEILPFQNNPYYRPENDGTCFWGFYLCDNTQSTDICGASYGQVYLKFPGDIPPDASGYKDIYLYARITQHRNQQNVITDWPGIAGGFYITHLPDPPGPSVFHKRARVGRCEAVLNTLGVHIPAGNSDVNCMNFNNVILSETVPPNDSGNYIANSISDICEDNMIIKISSQNDMNCMSNRSISIQAKFTDELCYDTHDAYITDGFIPTFCLNVFGIQPTGFIVSSETTSRDYGVNIHPLLLNVSITGITDNNCLGNVPCSNLNQEHILSYNPYDPNVGVGAGNVCSWIKHFEPFDYPPSGIEYDNSNYNRICCIDDERCKNSMCLDEISFTIDAVSTNNAALTFRSNFKGVPLAIFTIPTSSVTGHDFNFHGPSIGGINLYNESYHRCNFSGISIDVQPVYSTPTYESSPCIVYDDQPTKFFRNGDAPEQIMITIPNNWKPVAIQVADVCPASGCPRDQWGFVCGSCGYVAGDGMPVGSFILNRADGCLTVPDSSHYGCNDTIVSDAKPYRTSETYYYYNPSRDNCCGVSTDLLKTYDYAGHKRVYHGTYPTANVCGWEKMSLTFYHVGFSTPDYSTVFANLSIEGTVAGQLTIASSVAMPYALTCVDPIFCPGASGTSYDYYVNGISCGGCIGPEHCSQSNNIGSFSAYITGLPMGIHGDFLPYIDGSNFSYELTSILGTSHLGFWSWGSGNNSLPPNVDYIPQSVGCPDNNTPATGYLTPIVMESV